MVTGRPLTWRRIEGLAVAGAGLALFAGTGQSWWLIPVLFLVPDLSWPGYLAGHHPAVPAHDELRAIAQRVSAHPLPAPAASRQPQVRGLDGPPRAVGAGQQHARHLSRPAWR